MKCVMLYETAPDGLEKARVHYQAPQARLDEFRTRSSLLMASQ